MLQTLNIVPDKKHEYLYVIRIIFGSEKRVKQRWLLVNKSQQNIGWYRITCGVMFMLTLRWHHTVCTRLLIEFL